MSTSRRVDYDDNYSIQINREAREMFRIALGLDVESAFRIVLDSVLSQTGTADAVVLAGLINAYVIEKRMSGNSIERRYMLFEVTHVAEVALCTTMRDLVAPKEKA